MCGIFGAISNYLSSAEKDNVYSLAAVSILRGTDSSGIAVACTDKEQGKSKRMYKTRKSLFVAPAMLLEQGTNKVAGPYEIFMGNKEQVHAVIGHCRAATVGEVNISNAHPHTYGDLIGVHNGTMKSIIPKNAVFSKENKDSDSFQIYKYIHTHGVAKFWEEYETSGAFALVWFDISDNTLNVLRNNQRTLYWTGHGNGTMYWASEKDFLVLALNRGSGSLDSKDIRMFEAGVHYKSEIYGDRAWKETKLESKPYIPFVPAYKKTESSTSVPWKPHGCQSTTTSSDGTKSVPFLWSSNDKSTPASVPDATHHSVTTKSGRVRFINTKTFKDRRCTCDWCSTPIDVDSPMNWIVFVNKDDEEAIMEDASITEFINTHTLRVCEDCRDDSSVKEIFSDYSQFVLSTPINARLNPEFAQPKTMEG